MFDIFLGSFLLVRLHMDSLASKLTVREVRTALDVLPEEVNATYAEAMERISVQEECRKDLAKRVLTWITYTCRPLSLEELQHALAVSSKTTVMHPEAMVPKQILTSVCVGLVVIDENINIIRLVRM